MIKKITISCWLMIISLFSISQQNKTYTNPVLAGFYPDPSICKVGTDYYLVNSSFAYFPGLPIFHSKDLVNWQQLGNAMDRPGQMDLKGAGVSRGLFAPALRYHNGIYYITCTLVDKGGNFVITAKNAKGPWSNPVWLTQVNGIDPSLFFDDDKAYIVYNSIPPDNKSLYNGHRTIRMMEFDPVNLKTAGDEKIIINGGTDINKNPVWIEGPHIYKKDGWYYLLCAEGGTGDQHSEVVFRGRSAEGPYLSYENNPILTQRQLDPARKDPITSTGHADLVEATTGKWYAVFLGCRPYEGDYYNTGRETFMAPVEWKNGWPIINPGKEEVQYRYPLPFPKQTLKVNNNFSGNFYFKDDFTGEHLNNRWTFLRVPEESWYSLSKEKKGLSMKLLPQACAGKENPAFMGFRQSNLQGTAAISLDFDPSSENEKAGLLIFQNETHFYFIGISLGEIPNGHAVSIQLYQSTSDIKKMELLASQPLPANTRKNIGLQIKANKGTYSFYYMYDNKPWQLLADNINGKFLSTKDAGGFVGSMYALYATSSGIKSDKNVLFNWFEYKGDDSVYK